MALGERFLSIFPWSKAARERKARDLRIQAFTQVYGGDPIRAPKLWKKRTKKAQPLLDNADKQSPYNPS